MASFALVAFMATTILNATQIIMVFLAASTVTSAILLRALRAIQFQERALARSDSKPTRIVLQAA